VRCSFVHFGDVHLGTQQYDSLERLNDFGRAWIFACQYIAERRPDFAVCTGDLFNRFSINPITFDQAYSGLAILRDAGVPLVDVQGNHDRSRYGEAKTWIHTLADQGLLTHLDVRTSTDGPRLEPIAAGSRSGSYVEWAGCRIIGVRYLGASTERFLEALEPELDRLGRDTFTILVLHAGLEGIVPHLNAELSVNAVERLRDRIDYLALGHIHKHYSVGNLAFNGGSLETWASNEWGWNRGLLDVTVDTGRSPAVTFDLVDVPRRPFSIVRIDVGHHAEPETLLRACYDELQSERRRLQDARPVAIISLRGRLRFDASALPVNAIENMARQILDPVALPKVREDVEGREFVDEGGEEDDDRPVDRLALERQILQARFAQDERYASQAALLADVAAELKHRALDDESGQELLGTLRVLRAAPKDVTSSTPSKPLDVAAGLEAVAAEAST
jgi:DNA repair exonuclease SbcCD nuclease subunit